MNRGDQKAICQLCNTIQSLFVPSSLFFNSSCTLKYYQPHLWCFSSTWSRLASGLGGFQNSWHNWAGLAERSRPDGSSLSVGACPGLCLQSQSYVQGFVNCLLKAVLPSPLVTSCLSSLPLEVFSPKYWFTKALLGFAVLTRQLLEIMGLSRATATIFLKAYHFKWFWSEAC